MSNYDESFDPAGGFAGGDQGSDNDGGLIPEGDYEALPVSDTIDIGFPNNKPRCAFSVALYRGERLMVTQTLYQGLDIAQPAALAVTESMLCALGATDPIADAMNAIKTGLDVARLAGIDTKRRVKARVKHENYEGNWRLKVSLFGDAFKDKIPQNARQQIAAGLAGWQRANPRGAPISPPQPRR